jgi:hypothetical protein
MHNFDRDDEQALRRLDELALEEVRVQMVSDRDDRLEIVIQELVLRAVRAIESVCRTRGADRGLSREQVLRSIEDASVRLLLRLNRPDRQPAVTAVAADIAAKCVDAQTPAPSAPPRLAPRRAQLCLAEQLGDAVKLGRARRNDWKSS